MVFISFNGKSTNIFTYSLEFQKGLVPILKFHSREPSLSNFYSAKIETLPFLQYAQITMVPEVFICSNSGVVCRIDTVNTPSNLANRRLQMGDENDKKGSDFKFDLPDT